MGNGQSAFLCLIKERIDVIGGANEQIHFAVQRVVRGEGLEIVVFLVTVFAFLAGVIFESNTFGVDGSEKTAFLILRGETV